MKYINKLIINLHTMQPSKLLYILYIPLLIVEWVADLVKKLWMVIHAAIEEMTLAIENKINEPPRTKPSSTNKG